MIKLNILNMENFLKTVNTCKSGVHMLDSLHAHCILLCGGLLNRRSPGILPGPDGSTCQVLFLSASRPLLSFLIPSQAGGTHALSLPASFSVHFERSKLYGTRQIHCRTVP